MPEYIERQSALNVCEMHSQHCLMMHDYSGDATADNIKTDIETIPTADVVEVDKVAEILRLLFGDDCACNYNGNDEWLWEKCKYADTDCPMPKERLGCWKEFVRAMLAKMDGKGEGE